jgi:hypothetical protein
VIHVAHGRRAAHTVETLGALSNLIRANRDFFE